ncbi:MAG: hypothetical protein ACLP5H_03850 [Desulfomonilaceae bacterium]
MAKNKPKGVSTSKTSSIRALIREHHNQENDIENTAENPGTDAVIATEDALTASKLTDANAPPEKTAPTVSRPQFYNQVTAHILGDCAVQPDASGIYDVLARNFGDSGMLSWWLHRIGHADMTKLGRRKDLFDYLRLVSNALHRELKHDLGRPVARM